MPFQIVRNDITKMKVDAIVNAANKYLRPGGGVCGAIHQAAGPQLAGECKLLGGCETGEAKVTYGYNLPSKYVIHTVGPVWQGGDYGEKELLYSCYKNTLLLAEEKGCKSIAFPLISSGIFGYPKKQALKVAMDAIGDFLLENDMQVYLAVFNKECLNISKGLFSNIEEYIDEHYIEAYESSPLYRTRRMRQMEVEEHKVISKAPAPCKAECFDMEQGADLDQWLDQIDESFSEMVLRKIEEKGMTNAQCYTKANVDKKLFSKIKLNKDYKPKKENALALAIGLELSLEETQELLGKAGLALSHSSKFDIIVEYFIVHKQYNVHEINQVLFNYDQPLLGAVIQ
ncbi:MAG: macro domain-containing protein [Firmicutes bacterium]|nr:macro domain-containing protein [Bacillota bacterium]